MMKRSVTPILFAVLTLAAILGSGAISSVAYAKATFIQWDITSLAFDPGPVLSSGGVAEAIAEDGSNIILTGTGTFVAPREGQRSSGVTGGGTWETFDKDSNSTGNGTYEVTSLVSWHKSPGMLPSPPVRDTIGDASDTSAGLAVMTIEFSDGSHGVLIVSCFLPGAPPSLFEGITVTKGFLDYWETLGVHENVNRTLFHIIR